MKWHVPHFEKMLYDNGQLTSLHSDAFKLTKKPLYKEVVEKTLNFVEREWLTAEGGFYSAFDADSLNQKGHTEEGAFYVWKKSELEAILKEDFELFSAIFSINDFGYWEDDNYVLIQEKPLEVIANKFNLSTQELQSKKESFEKKLFEIRQKRPKPGLDDKIITSWNAIMNRGYTDAYKAFGEVKYLEIAQNNIEFIKRNLWSENGNLYRTYKNKTAKINGFLEDYAFVIDALLGLYEVTANENYLIEAKQLADYTLDNFYDSDKGLFRFKSIEDNSLVTENYEIEDNVIDSSNSVMARNLYTLSIYFGLMHYEDICQRMLRIVVSNIDYPSAFSNWLNVWMNFDKGQKELAICGTNAIENLKVINQNYFPNLIVSATEKSSNLPFLKGRYTDNILQFFICQNRACDLPLRDIEQVLHQLKY